MTLRYVVVDAGSDGDLVQTGSTIVRLLQRDWAPSLERPVQLPVPGVSGAVPPGWMASPPTLARPAPTLPQVVHGNVTWPSRVGIEGPQGARTRDDAGRQRRSGEHETHLQVVPVQSRRVSTNKPRRRWFLTVPTAFHRCRCCRWIVYERQ